MIIDPKGTLNSEMATQMAGRASRSQSQQEAYVFTVASLPKPSALPMIKYLDGRDKGKPIDESAEIIRALLATEQHPNIRKAACTMFKKVDWRQKIMNLPTDAAYKSLLIAIKDYG